ncbi:S41 family peptidase [Massilicoli timonensis]|uniref:S41 family peptidase n=1 Tax=Massilicoli timonensis TaxID=2015901 RepID=UPI0015E10ED7|nr:S41 family peptidase [Massilicoli timonensis]
MTEERNPEQKKKTVQVKLVRHKWPDEIAAEKALRRKTILLVIGAILFFGIGYACNAVTKTNGVASSSANQKLNEVYDIMLNQWYFGKDIDSLDEALLNQALKGMSGSESDPYTSYLTKEETMELSSSLQGSVMGIGVEYVYLYDSGSFYIVNVFANGPAGRAGLCSGDQIISVNEESVAGLDSDALREKIVGEKGTSVRMQVKRENKLLDFEIERGEVASSVFGEVKGSVGILTIASFAENSGELVGDYLKEFDQQGVTSLIVDLRGNGGGYVQAAVDIANHLLPEDSVVLYEEKRDGSMSENRTSGSGKQYRYDAMAVLVDGDTASASEVLTAALRHYLDAEIVGVNTFGKGTVQITKPFADGSSLKYTIAQWLTPAKEKIHGKGIAPDVEIASAEAHLFSPVALNGTYAADSVSQPAVIVQKELAFLGYAVDREDGYFSTASSEALKQYQRNIGMETDGVIDQAVMDALYSSVQLKWNAEKETLDTQMIKAMEVVNDR